MFEQIAHMSFREVETSPKDCLARTAVSPPPYTFTRSLTVTAAGVIVVVTVVVMAVDAMSAPGVRSSAWGSPGGQTPVASGARGRQP